MADRCIWCGHVEGLDGTVAERRVFDELDGFTHWTMCPTGGCDDLTCDDGVHVGCDDNAPLPRGYAYCDDCSRVFPLHALVKSQHETLCRDDVDPRRLVSGYYEPTTCDCDRCVERAWRKMVGRPSPSASEPRRASGATRSGDTAADPHADRLKALKDALSEPRTTAELALLLNVDQRTVQRLLKEVDAVSTRDGKSIRWSLPSGTL